jgi:RNA polymerase sigma-70 factor (ECF subfamily)
MSVGLDETEAIDRAARRDASGLEWLYDRYATRVYSLALRIVRDTADAEDVTQEVFVQVWTHAATFDASRGAVAAWLTMLARSRALDRLRRRGAGPQSGGEHDALANIQDPAPSVEWMAANAQQVAAARDALATLPAEQRATLELVYFDGLTQSEIAERTATPIGTVKTRIRTGLQRMRDVVGTRRSEA